MRPFLRENAIIRQSLFEREGAAGVEAVVKRVRENVQGSARSFGLINPQTAEVFRRWFGGQHNLQAWEEDEGKTWQDLLPNDVEYVIVVMEGDPVPAASEPTPEELGESDYDAQNRYRKEHGCLAPEQR